MIDFRAREIHFLEHLAPVWHALPELARGRFYVDARLLSRALELELDAVEGWPTRDRSRACAVASWGDLRIVTRVRPVSVLFEHGAGQSYRGEPGSRRHASYVGGRGREGVKLFVVPGQHAAAANRRYYPTTPNAVVGSPRVDALAQIPRLEGPRAAALSFHWRCKVSPETGSAIDHFAHALEKTRVELEAAGVELLGHGHPRIFSELEELYLEAGIEPVRSFEEVVARADLYAVDNSSTLFEFAALDRPVVVLNSPEYRRGIEHGLRFWDAASVGLQVDRPAELASSILEALEDRPELAASRAAAVARVYACTDGTSARRAATALLELVKRCKVCGADHAACGPTTDVEPIDEIRDRPGDRSVLKKYPNPQKPGAFLRLNDRDAAALGLTGQAVERGSRPVAPPVPIDSATHETDAPKGALPPGGPTARARAAARSAPDAPEDGEEEPKDKKRPAPRTRRRRPTSSDGS